MRFYTPAKKCKLYMDWTLSDCVAHWLGARNTKRPGISDSDSTLPRHQKNPTPAGGRILVNNKEIIDCPIGYDSGCEYYATMQRTLRWRLRPKEQ